MTFGGSFGGDAGGGQGGAAARLNVTAQAALIFGTAIPASGHTGTGQVYRMHRRADAGPPSVGIKNRNVFRNTDVPAEISGHFGATSNLWGYPWRWDATGAVAEMSLAGDPLRLDTEIHQLGVRVNGKAVDGNGPFFANDASWIQGDFTLMVDYTCDDVAANSAANNLGGGTGAGFGLGSHVVGGQGPVWIDPVTHETDALPASITTVNRPGNPYRVHPAGWEYRFRRGLTGRHRIALVRYATAEEASVFVDGRLECDHISIPGAPTTAGVGLNLTFGYLEGGHSGDGLEGTLWGGFMAPRALSDAEAISLTTPLRVDEQLYP